MYKRMKLVAMIIVICMLVTMLPAGSVEKYEASEKVGSDLLELMNVTYEDLSSGNFEDTGETYSCIIWIEDVEIEEAVEDGIDAAEQTQEGYSTWSLYDYPYTTYEVDGLTYVDVSLDDDVDDEYVQTYIEAEREAAAELYSENNSSFVAENFMARDMSVTYVSKYSPCIFADLSITKIAELMKVDEVVHIGDSMQGMVENASNGDGLGPCITTSQIESLMTTVNIDAVQERYGVDGSGIKMGQVELYVPLSDEVVKQEYSVADSHASDVQLILSTVAPESDYYAVGIGTGLFIYEDIEWLLSQGVNIINASFSMGEYFVYSELSRWIDHIAYNHDVHFVASSGNEFSEGVRSLALAYNIITVGATINEEGYSLARFTEKSGSSYVKADRVSRPSYITYKPDIVAPGVINTDLWGTSYAAPLVAGSIALMCEYRPALKTRQFVVKAILAASTSKTKGKYVTTDDLFCKYGAGMMDLSSAFYVLRVGKYGASTGVLENRDEEKTYDMVVTSSDTEMRIAVAYGYRIKYDEDVTEHDGTNLPGAIIGSIQFYVYSPTGELVASSSGSFTGADGNLKIVEFDPRLYGTGTYTIKVKLVVPQTSGKMNFGIAWR